MTYKFEYLNSGVLLLNLNNIRKNKTFENARQMCVEKNMFMLEQSSINILSNNKLVVERKYNEKKKIKKMQHYNISPQHLYIFYILEQEE